MDAVVLPIRVEVGRQARIAQDAEAVVVLAASAGSGRMVEEDRETARSLGDPAHHALFVFGRKDVFRLPGPGASAREIIAAIREAV